LPLGKWDYSGPDSERKRELGRFGFEPRCGMGRE
jgi:hypothetical protein